MRIIKEKNKYINNDKSSSKHDDLEEMLTNNFQLDVYGLQNMIRMKVLLDAALDKLDKPKDYKQEIIIPTGPVDVINEKSIGFPNVIMKVGNDSSYYVKNAYHIFSSNTTGWNNLGSSFSKLLLEKEARNDERKDQRRLDYGKLESKDGVGIIHLNNINEIKTFREELNKGIDRLKEKLKGNKSFEVVINNERKWKNIEPNYLLNHIRQGIDYKFDDEGEQKPRERDAYIDYRKLQKLDMKAKERNHLNLNKVNIPISNISNKNVKIKAQDTAKKFNFKRVGKKNEKTKTCC